MEVDIHFFNQHIARRAWLQAGRVWRPNAVTPRIYTYFFKIENKGKMEIASWRKESWGMCVAMACNDWTLTVTMVWLNGNAYCPRFLKTEGETIKIGWTKERVFASWRVRSWALDVAIWCNSWNLWRTTVFLDENGNWQRCLKTNQKEGVVRSKKQTGWDTVDHWHARGGGLFSNDWLEDKKDLITNGTCVTP